MKKKVALITGVSGQDGAYLAKFLLDNNYTVVGADRRSSRSDYWRLKRLNINNNIIFEELELAEINEMIRLIKKYNFNEIYNLAAQSFVQSSFSSPINTANISGLGVLRILEVIRNFSPTTKFYQASSSEMFGNTAEKKQNEKTPFNPMSPYAIAKVFGHFVTKNYRDSYNLFAVSGILFNHESPLRGEEFVTRKITLGLVKIINGDLDFLELGNIYSKRDWGYAKEYVKIMWKMLQQTVANDYVISTGETHTVKEFINEAVKYLDLKTTWKGKGLNEELIDLEKNKPIIKISKRFFRPAEVDILLGNSAKAEKYLKWKPETNFKDLVKIMMENELKYYK
jgi:GDPmannose 4,6-dehydratase